MEERKNVYRLLESACIGIVGGVLFSLLHLPLPWMLGPLTMITVWRLATRRVQRWPVMFRKIAMIIFGYMLGASFTKDTVMLITKHLPFMAATTLLMVTCSLLLGIGLSRLIKIETKNGIYGFIPGGFSQLMVVIDGSEKLEPTVIAFMQTIRAITVIFLVPFITIHYLITSAEPLSATVPQIAAPPSLMSFGLYILLAVIGAFVGNYFRLPGSFLTGSLLTTSFLAGSGLAVPQIPSLMITIAQLSLGIYLGLQIDPKEIKNVKKLLAYMVGSSLLLVLFAFLQAFLLTIWTPLEMKTAFLSTAPGGIAEMGMTAVIVGADLPLVSSYQIFRLFFIMLVVVPFFQWLLTRSTKKSESANISP
ncbi:MAG: putative ammonia monooxygenase [Brevibacillus sp.]|nr:putative ammonia monooxygenase [Brevibacillus sp.]